MIKATLIAPRLSVHPLGTIKSTGQNLYNRVISDLAPRQKVMHGHG